MKLTPFNTMAVFLTIALASLADAQPGRQQAEAQRQAQQAQRNAEAQRQAQQAQRNAEAQRQAQQAQRNAEAQRQAQQAQRNAEAQRQAQQAQRNAEAQRQAQQAQRNADAQRSQRRLGTSAANSGRASDDSRRFNYATRNRAIESRRLSAAGIVRSGIKSYQTHHVIPLERKIRDLPIIRQSGFNIRGGQNVMYLPKAGQAGGAFGNRPVHSGSHPQYSNAIYGKLNDLSRIGVAAGWNQSQYRRALGEVIRDTRSQLRSAGPGRLK